MKIKKAVQKSILLVTILVLSAITIFAQDYRIVAADSLQHKKKISWQKLKLYFDDDYLNFTARGTDQYYTAGWQADIYYKRNRQGLSIFDRLLFGLPHGNDIYFYGVLRKIYTPVDLLHGQVVNGDRPYASVLTMQHGLTSINNATNESITTEMGAGAIGPITYGGEIQNRIHSLIGGQKAMGWGNQIRNNVVLDYKLNYEKQVLNPTEHLKMLADMDCEAGTLVDNVGVGFTLAFGSFNRPNLAESIDGTRKSRNHNGLTVHCFMHPTVRAVLYNATLEGGFFSKFDPYVINRANINTIYLQYDMGVVLQAGKLVVSMAEKLRTAEFNTGQVQEVGNVTLYVPL